MPATKSKTCTRCGATKPLAEFYKQKDCLYGRAPQCKVCHKAYVKAYQQANRDKVAAWGKVHRERHPQKERERQRKWQQANREKHLAARKRRRDRTREKRAAAWAAYYEANAEKVRAAQKAKYDPDKKRANRNPAQTRLDADRRRTRLVAAYVEDVPFDYVLQRDLGICGICHQPIMGKIDLDHIVPLAAGGKHERTNVQLAHPTCNRMKWDKVNFTLPDAA